MKPPTFSATDLPLLTGQLESWRRRQSGRRRLPAELWAAAAQLARTHGVSQVARALGLSFYRLQRQAREGPPTEAVAAPASPFIELKLDTPPDLGPPTGCVELSDGARRRMRLYTGRDPAAWEALARSFWRREA